MKSSDDGGVTRRAFASGIAASAALSMRPHPARAATAQVHVITQIGLSYLPLHLMQHDRLWESQAAARGIDARIVYSRLGGGAALNDALISDAAQVVAGGVAPLLILWDRTRSNYRVVGLSALSISPMYLLGNRPELTSIRDLKLTDRVAVPSLRVSIQAAILEMGIAQTFGAGALDRYVSCEVAMAHPDAYAALVSRVAPITAYMSSSPFQERALKQPHVVRIADSFDIQGGPATFSVAYTRQRFIDDNPKLVEAYYPALEEAIDQIARDPGGALDKYVVVTGDATDRALLEEILRGRCSFGAVPSRTKPVADFLASRGTLTAAPASWDDYFAQPLHGQAGS